VQLADLYGSALKRLQGLRSAQQGQVGACAELCTNVCTHVCTFVWSLCTRTCIHVRMYVRVGFLCVSVRVSSRVPTNPVPPQAPPKAVPCRCQSAGDGQSQASISSWPGQPCQVLPPDTNSGGTTAMHVTSTISVRWPELGAKPVVWRSQCAYALHCACASCGTLKLSGREQFVHYSASHARVIFLEGAESDPAGGIGVSTRETGARLHRITRRVLSDEVVDDLEKHRLPMPPPPPTPCHPCGGHIFLPILMVHVRNISTAFFVCVVTALINQRCYLAAISPTARADQPQDVPQGGQTRLSLEGQRKRPSNLDYRNCIVPPQYHHRIEFTLV
jgi:hypothetical protein